MNERRAERAWARGLAAVLLVAGLVAGGTPAAAVLPQSCTDGMITLMQQTTMDLDSAYRLRQAALTELRASFGDRVGATELLAAADANLLGIQSTTLDAVVLAVNSYEPPLTASAPGPAPTLSYSAAASSTYSTYFAVNAVDGNEVTKWSSVGPVRGQWLMVDLGDAFQIDRFRVYQAEWADWRASSYRVQSADAPSGSWTDRHAYTSAAPFESGVVAFASGPATARYWRVASDAGGGNGWEIFTFAVFARAVVVPTADPETCLDGLALQLQELVAAAGAGMDAVVADLRLVLALLPLPEAPTTVVVPTSQDACKNGGWAEAGLGFKNQGDCVSWVVVGGRNTGTSAKAGR